MAPTTMTSSPNNNQNEEITLSSRPNFNQASDTTASPSNATEGNSNNNTAPTFAFAFGKRSAEEGDSFYDYDRNLEEPYQEGYLEETNDEVQSSWEPKVIQRQRPDLDPVFQQDPLPPVQVTTEGIQIEVNSNQYDNNLDYLDAPQSVAPKVQQINTGSRLEHQKPFNYGQQGHYDDVSEYDPLEIPSSLQAILSNHHVKTNFLKTPARTEHFGYQTEPATEYQPSGYQPSNMMSQLTPKRDIPETVPSKYHEIAQRFYTSSGNASPGHRNTHQAFAEDTADDRFDSGDSQQQVEGNVESKENPILNTAVIALKLSTKLLDLYKTVSPYLS